jgi:protein SCO1/2
MSYLHYRRLLHVLFLWVSLFALHPSLGGATEPQKTAPRFILIDQNERTITSEALRGKPSLIQFGFTRCPVVCPTTLYELARIMEELGPIADQFNFIFVTVDPDRDTPQSLKDYVGNFDERILGLTGQITEIERLAAGLGATFAKQQQGSDYTMDHTIHAFLLDKDWHVDGTIYVGPDAVHAKVIDQLKRVLGAQAAR